MKQKTITVDTREIPEKGDLWRNRYYSANGIQGREWKPVTESHQVDHNRYEYTKAQSGNIIARVISSIIKL